MSSSEPVATELLVGGSERERVRPVRSRSTARPGPPRLPPGVRRWSGPVAGYVLAVVTVPVVFVALLARAHADPPPAGAVAHLPDHVYTVPLHAPIVRPGSGLGQPAAVLLAGVPRAGLLAGTACCSTALVGAMSDVAGFVDLPGLTPTTSYGWDARLSPDGRSIAYAAGRSLGLLDVVGGRLRTVPLPDGYLMGPVMSWSADGAHLLVTFTRAQAVGFSRLAVLDLVHSSWTLPPQPDRWTGSGRAAALSTDGSQVAYVGGPDLWIESVAEDGGDPLVVVSGIRDSQVAWGWGEPSVSALTLPGAAVGGGPRQQMTVVTPGLGSLVEVVDGDYDALTLLARTTGSNRDDILLSDRGGSYSLVWLDESQTRLTTITALPAQSRPTQVDAASGLARGTRHAGPPADPTAVAARTALLAGLLVALVVTLCLPPVRRLLRGVLRRV